ncbi:MAG: alanine racemase [Pseudomonadota bacterium]
MGTGHLTIDLGALQRNYRDLDALSQGETAAVVKADGYGLGLARAARALAEAGARTFCVATAEEGARLRAILGQGPVIYVFSGHMEGDAAALDGADLVPLLNSVDQMLRHVEALPGAPFGVQLDTGMNRLGMEPAEWSALRDIAIAQGPRLLMSHLACADEPDHPMNAAQLQVFRELTDGLDIPRSLAATGGTLLGPDYHFDMTRPGIGVYGGLPFVDATPVVHLDLPVIQIRPVAAGETVGYGNTWTAPRDAQIATLSAGYADGLIRAMGPRAHLHDAEGRRVPVVGRVSMDLITADVTDLPAAPEHLQILGRHQSVDTLAKAAGTIGYEILTSLGARYSRSDAP